MIAFIAPALGVVVQTYRVHHMEAAVQAGEARLHAELARAMEAEARARVAVETADELLGRIPAGE